MQPVGEPLSRNTAGRAVFHQPYIVDVRHFGAAHSLINPAHHIAQNALCIVFYLAADLLFGPSAISRQRNIQNSVHMRASPALAQLRLHGKHIYLVIVQRMQGRRGRRWNPSTGCSGFRVLDLLLHHCRHEIGHRPHPLSDLRFTRQATLKADIDIEVFICPDPTFAFDKVLAAKRPCFHRGMNFIARAVKKTCVDESNSRFRGADAFFEVHRGASLFVHHTDFHGIGGQSEQALNAAKYFIRKSDFLGPVHLGFYDVD